MPFFIPFLIAAAPSIVSALQERAFPALMEAFSKKKEEGADSRIKAMPSQIKEAMQRKLSGTDLDTAMEWKAKAEALGIQLDMSKFDALKAKADEAQAKLQELAANLSPGQMQHFTKVMGNVAKGASTKYPGPAKVIRQATALAAKKQRSLVRGRR